MPIIVTTEELVQEQETDEQLQKILQEGTHSLQLRKLRLDNTETTIYCDISQEEVRPYVPVTLRKRIFDSTYGLSHPSGRTTKQLISRRFVWPGMNKHINEWARTCLPCQRNKIHRHNRSAPEHIPIPNTRFNHIHIDILGPLPIIQGYRYCVTIIDRFTRWPEAIPVKNMAADTIIGAFFKGWIARFGASEIITTDQGTQFESLLFKALTNLIGSQCTRTSAYHPASNGMIERWHRSLKTAIRCHESKNWLEALLLVLLGLRSSYKENLKSTAAEMNVLGNK